VRIPGKALSGTVVALVGMYLLIGCGGNKTQSHLPVRELFQQAKFKYDHKKYLSAIELFQSVVYNYPGETIIDTAQYYLALSYFGNHDYSLAEAEFNRYVLNYPTSAFATESQMMKAVCAFEATPHHFGLDQSQLDDAIRQLDDFITDHPDAESTADAKKYLAAAKERLAHKYYNSAVTYDHMGQYAAAKVYYQKVIDDYTETEYAALAGYYIANAEMNLKQYDDARKRFETFILVFPQHPLVPKAAVKAREAALKGAVAIYDKGDLKAAGEKFSLVQKDFPDSDQARKAAQYLEKIRRQVPDTAQSPNAKS
jgi:outer membrane protein assembly factor BamD